MIQMPQKADRHHYLNGVSSLARRWWPNIECWLPSFMIFQGIRTIITRKPYFRGSGPLAPPPLDPRIPQLHIVDQLTAPWEWYTHNTESYYMTSRRHYQLSLPQRDDYKPRKDIPLRQFGSCLFVWFDSLRPINNLSVKQRRVFLCWFST